MPTNHIIDEDLDLAQQNIICSVPEGADALLLAKIWRQMQTAHKPQDLVFVARDDVRLQAIADNLKFYLPQISPLTIPAWDCLPYDRVSPSQNIVGNRLKAFAILTSRNKQAATNKTVQPMLHTRGRAAGRYGVI